MNLLHLKYAIEVEKTQSISQAAENLYMGQPNLSRALKDLEASLGITVFRRTSKGVFPTERGAEFLQYARSIVSQVNDMEAHFSKSSSDVDSFSLSAPRTTYIALAFSKFVSSLGSDVPHGLGFYETNSINAVRNVEEGISRISIIRYDKDHEQYFLDYLRDHEMSHEELWSFSHLVVTRKDSPLASAESLQRKDLYDYTEIRRTDMPVPYLLQQSESGSASKRQISIYERGSQFELLSGIPNAYMLVSPIPEELLSRYNLVLRPCKGVDEIYKDVLVCKKNHKLTKTEKKFLKILDEEQKKLSVKVYR